MPTKQQNDKMYMQIAQEYSKLSKAVRKQVGACLVTKHGVVLGGVNGMPVGGSNVCETEKEPWFGTDDSPLRLVTKPEVIHAETNAILRCAREGVSSLNSTVYVTMSPCLQCAAMLVNAGIKRLVYGEMYRDGSGVELLKDSGVEVESYYEGVKYANTN